MNTMHRRMLAIIPLLLALDAWAQSLMTPDDLGPLHEAPAPDSKFAYGADPLQFAHLRLPRQDGPHPVVILIHGGCWLGAFDLGHTAAMAHAIASAGYAVWNVEYRRVGNAGGGWPQTFLDVGRAVDHLRLAAREHPLDLDRVVVMGHSAGGALALWVAAREKLDPTSDLHMTDPLAVRGVVALAPAADLEAIQMRESCGDVIGQLMGGTPTERPERYAAASPMGLVPLGLPQVLVIGAHDTAWAPTGLSYYHRAVAVGDQQIQLITLPESGHFEMINPESTSWTLVMDALHAAFRDAPPASSGTD